MKNSPERTGAVLVVIAAMLWGTTGTAQALAPPAAEPLSIGSLRLAIGGAALIAIWALRRLRNGSPAPKKLGDQPGRPILPVLLAAAGLATYQPLFFSAVQRTGVAVGTIVTIGTAPIFTALLSALINQKIPDRAWFLATPISIAGLFGLSWTGQGSSADLHGIALALGAGMSFAILTLASAAVLKALPPDSAMAFIAGLAAVFLLPLLIGMDLDWLNETRGLLAISHLGLLATAASYTLFIRGLRHVPAPSAATLSLAEPLTAALLAVFILGERLPALSWIGLGLVFVGLAVLVAFAEGIAEEPVEPFH